MGKVGKIAQRVKVTERVTKCITPGVSHVAVPVQFYPERGRPQDAMGCATCEIVWNKRTKTILATRVPGL